MARQDRDTPAKVRQQRSPLNLRTTPELRAMIEKAARENDLSMTQEVERRLLQSFSAEANLGGRQTAALLRSLAGLFELAEASTGKSWRDDWETFSAVRKATVTALAAHSPLAPTEVNASSRNAEEARAAYEEVAQRYERRVGTKMATPASSRVLVVHQTNALGALFDTSSNFAFPEDDPATGKPWTVDAMKEVNALLEEALDRSRELSAASAALREAMEPVNQARQRGLELADKLLGTDQEVG